MKINQFVRILVTSVFLFQQILSLPGPSFAANAPITQADGTSVFTLTKPATDTSTQPQSGLMPAVVQTQTTIDFQMDNGGLAKSTSVSASSPGVDISNAQFYSLTQISDGPRVDVRRDAKSFFTHPYGSYIREGNTLHLTFPGSPKPYDGTSQDPGFYFGSGYATDQVYYTSSTDNGKTWSTPVTLIKPFTNPEGTQKVEQSACMNSIVKFGEYYYIFFESYMPVNWMLGIHVARSKTIGGGYEIYTENGWQKTNDGATPYTWKPIITPKILESEAGRRLAMESLNGDIQNPLYGAGLPTARVVDGEIVLNYLDTTYDYKDETAYHGSMESRMQVEIEVDENGNLQPSTPINLGEKVQGNIDTVRWLFDQAVYFPEIQQYLMFNVDRNTREIFVRASLDGVIWDSSPKVVGYYPAELMRLSLEYGQKQGQYNFRVLTDENGNGSLSDLRLILGGDYIFEHQTGAAAGFGNLYEFKANLAFNTWDNTGDGKADAFDLNGDGKADGWSNRVDGKINFLDMDHDPGHKIDAWSSRDDGQINMWDTDGKDGADVFDSDGDERADWGSKANTFTEAQVAYMKQNKIRNTVDLNADGIIDAWTNRSDGKINIWDTDYDQKADAFDSDGDGKADNFDFNEDGKMDAWSNRPDGKINMWDTKGTGDEKPDVFDTNGDGIVDFGSQSNTFTAAQVAYMKQYHIRNTVDLNADGIIDAQRDQANGSADTSATGRTATITPVDQNGGTGVSTAEKPVTGTSTQSVEPAQLPKDWLADNNALTPSVTVSEQKIEFKAGWNLISINVHETRTFNEILGSQAQTSSPWVWKDGALSKVTIDEVPKSNLGYWIYSKENFTASFKGELYTDPSTDVKGGWNLFGVSAEVNVDQLKEVGTSIIQVYEFDGSAYKPVAKLTPGKAYWVLCQKDGTIINPNVIVPAVQAYVKALQEQVRDGFKVMVRRQDDETHLITVTDSKVYFQAPTSGLKELTFTVKGSGADRVWGTADDVVEVNNIVPTYYGVSHDWYPEGALLFKAMGVCPEGQVCTLQVLSDIEKFGKMTRIAVTSVEPATTATPGTIHFTLGDRNYKAYRDANGQVKVELLSGDITTEATDPGIRPQLFGDLPDEGQPILEIRTYDKGVLIGLRYQLDIYGDESVIRIMQMEVVDGHPTGEVESYSEQMKIAPAVRAYVDTLKQILGAGYAVKVTALPVTKCAEGTKCIGSELQYQINVIDTKIYATVVPSPAAGLLQELVFVLDKEAKLQSRPVIATYHDIAAVDGQLLFEAMGVCPQGGVCALHVVSDLEKFVKMTRLTVTKVENGVIYFTMGDKNYKAYRDAVGVVHLIDERGELIAYLERVSQAGAAYSQAIRNDFEKIAGVSATIPREELDAQIQRLGLSSEEATQLRNLHTYFRLNEVSAGAILSGDYGMIQREFPGFFNANGEPTDALNQFTAWAKSENLPAPDPVWIFQLPADLQNLDTATLQARVNEARAIMGDNPEAYYENAHASLETKAPQIVAAMDKIRLELSDLSKQLPPAVQAYVDELQRLLTNGYEIRWEIKYERCEAGTRCGGGASYRISVIDQHVYPTVIPSPAKGLLQELSFVLDADGKLQANSVKATYHDIAAVDGQLLFDAMGVCPQGGVCALHVVSDLEKFAKMAAITVLSGTAHGPVYYSLDAKVWKAYRDENGRVIVAPALIQSIQMSQGWNTFSTYIQDTRTIGEIFGTVEILVYDNELGGYQRVNAEANLETGVGYYIFASAAKAVTLVGEAETSRSIQVKQGWNLLGVAETFTVNDLKVLNPSIIGTIWGFEGNRMVMVNQLEPGKAYWIYVSAAGTIEYGAAKLAAKRSELIAYLDRVVQAGANYTQAIRNDFLAIAGVSNTITLEELESQIERLGLSDADASRLRNLYTYSRFYKVSADAILRGDYGKIQRTFPEFFSADGQPTEALNQFTAWAKSENLPVLDPVWILQLPADLQNLDTATLQARVNEARALMGDNPEAYYQSAHAALEAKAPEIVAAMGKIRVELGDLNKKLPPALQVYVNELQKRLESDFKITFAEQTDGSYLIKVINMKFSSVTTGNALFDALADTVNTQVQSALEAVLAGLLQELDFVLDKGGKLKADSIKAAFHNIATVDSPLLFEAMGLCPQGQVCTLEVIGDIEKLAKMTRIKIAKIESGAIYFKLDHRNYKAYRDERGVAQLVDLDQPHIDFVKNFYAKSGLSVPAGAGFTVNPLADGSVEVLVVLNRSGVAGQLQNQRFVLKKFWEGYQVVAAQDRDFKGTVIKNYNVYRESKSVYSAYTYTYRYCYNLNGQIVYYEYEARSTSGYLSRYSYAYTYVQGGKANGKLSDIFSKSYDKNLTVLSQTAHFYRYYSDTGYQSQYGYAVYNPQGKITSLYLVSYWNVTGNRVKNYGYYYLSGSLVYQSYYYEYSSTRSLVKSEGKKQLTETLQSLYDRLVIRA